MANNRRRNNNSHRRGNNKPNGNGGNNRPNSRGLTAQEAKDRNNRGDLMAKPTDGSNNDPAWYYSDPELMEQISRFPMTGIAGQGRINNHEIPSVMRIDLAPNLTNTELDFSNYSKANYLAALKDIKLRGINLASQKWWSMLTAASGRGSVYTKNDIAILFGAIGEIISVYEFIRRAFGVLTPYSQRNRSLPTILLEAMNVEPQDFIKEAPNYRLQMNTLIAMIDQLPIPGNVAYFAKCQDLYQHVYMDTQSQMAQFYVHVPAYTWKLDEDGLQSGSRLVPVDMAETWGSYQYVDRKPQKMQVYIDTLKEMVNELLSSSTYSVIYADILHVSATSNITLWTFDTIKEDYMVVPEYNEYALSQIHNSTWLGPVGSASVQRTASTWSTDHYTSFAPDEVVCDPNLDVVVQNTSLVGMCADNFGSTATTYTLVGYNGEGEDASSGTYSYNVQLRKPVLDLKTLEPDVTTRIDSTRYLATLTPQVTVIRSVASSARFAARRIVLPDHFIAGIVILTVNNASYDAKAGRVYPTSLMGCTITPSGTANVCSSFMVNVFEQHPALSYTTRYNSEWQNSYIEKVITGTNILFVPNEVLWDVDCWTALDDEWLRRVNDVAYIGLFDVR